jgi:hypothetical protein
MTFEEWFDNTCPEDSVAIKMNEVGSMSHLEAVVSVRKKHWMQFAYEQGRKEVLEEAAKKFENRNDLKNCYFFAKELRGMK